MAFSFGGPGSSMLQSYHSNENQRKKRKHFDKDALGSNEGQGKTEFNLPEASPQVLRDIRAKMKKQRQKFLLRTCAFGVLFLIFVVVLLNYLG
ncbi:MAG: hypothetical protein R2802_05950 [Flavobacteriaceae bacterium]|nr:hypothetical protein [Mangrovimonas sp.]MCB0435284.1 hypothetical protein [Mangrovimonas sp.]MCB0438682.1 hypothetical protein [Mangrovimonas sp.]